MYACMHLLGKILQVIATSLEVVGIMVSLRVASWLLGVLVDRHPNDDANDRTDGQQRPNYNSDDRANLWLSRSRRVIRVFSVGTGPCCSGVVRISQTTVLGRRRSHGGGDRVDGGRGVDGGGRGVDGGGGSGSCGGGSGGGGGSCRGR